MFAQYYKNMKNIPTPHVSSDCWTSWARGKPAVPHERTRFDKYVSVTIKLIPKTGSKAHSSAHWFGESPVCGYRAVYFGLGVALL